MNNVSEITKEEEGLNENLSIEAEAKDEIKNVIGDTLVRHYIVEKVEVFFTNYKSYRAYVKVKVSKDNVEAVLAEIESDKKIAQKKQNKSLTEKIEEVISGD